MYLYLDNGSLNLLGLLNLGGDGISGIRIVRTDSAGISSSVEAGGVPAWVIAINCNN